MKPRLVDVVGHLRVGEVDIEPAPLLDLVKLPVVPDVPATFARTLEERLRLGGTDRR